MIKADMRGKNATVLVGILKNKRDRDILFKERWYRIPTALAPVRKFSHLAFYQPASFKEEGKRIRYYAKVVRREIHKRRELLPGEPQHPLVAADYHKIFVGTIHELRPPIKNRHPRRISFGFTTLRRLKTAKTILDLYNVAATEEILAQAVREAEIAFTAQRWVTEKESKTRYCLDFAVGENIAIECDNQKSHSGKWQRQKDKTKDAFLRKHGWTVIRLKEKDIIKNLGACISRIKKAIKDRS